jgi:quinol-cytochrome oxidoreductase complex cytochrome b subunit
VKQTKENTVQDDPPSSQLFTVDEKSYGNNYKKHLFMQYKLCVEMADRTSSRRITANNFFLSVNTLLVAAIGALSRLGSNSISYSLLWAIIASVAGILFCLCWATTIRRYRDLNNAKFNVINAIEKKLPASAFTSEWKYLCQGKNADEYRHLTAVEYWVPMIFAALYVLLIIVVVILSWNLLSHGLLDP